MQSVKDELLADMKEEYPDMATTPEQPLPGTLLKIECCQSKGLTIRGHVSVQAGKLYQQTGGDWSLREVGKKMVFAVRYKTVERLQSENITMQLLPLFFCETVV